MAFSQRCHPLEEQQSSQENLELKDKANQDGRLKFIEKYAYYVQCARFYPQSTIYHLTWENHNFPQHNQVFDLTPDGKVQDYDYEQMMKNMKSVVTLWEEKDGFLKKAKSVILKMHIKGLMKFSKKGNYLTLIGRSNEVYIYRASDIHRMMDDIENQKYLQMIKTQKIEKLRKIYFSDDESILCFQFQKKIVRHHLKAQNKTRPSTFVIPEQYCNQHIQIYIAQIVGARLTEDGSDCIICCQRKREKKIDIFSINQGQDNCNTISYTRMKEGAHLSVKISKDLKQFFLNTGNESILLKDGKQDILRWFEEKNVHKIVTLGDEFICLACSDYDKEIDILSTLNPNFKLHIKRKITPKLVKFFDIKIQDNLLKILNVRDEEFFLDIVDLKKENDNITSIRTHSYKGFNFEWPYLAFVSMRREILIYNAFKPQEVLKINIAHLKDDQEMFETLDLTSNQGLFFISKKGAEHSLYHLSLDTLQFPMRPMMKWNLEDYGNRRVFKMFFRASSANDGYRKHLNLEHIALIQLENHLYVWSEDQEGLKFVRAIDYLTEIQSNNEKEYYWKADNEDVIEKLVLSFSLYEKVEVYREKEENTKIINFELDEGNKMYILTRFKTTFSKKYYIKIINIITNELLYKIQVADIDVIGQFQSGNMFILNGIMVYQNQIIKINFNNVKGMGEELQENIFQHYNEVLHLETKDKFIPYLSPILCYSFQKMLYTIKDEKWFSCKFVVILPFIDQRRSYFNNKDYLDQFCTLHYDDQNVDDRVKILNYVNECFNFLQNTGSIQKVYTYSLKGVLLNSYKIEEQKHGKPIAVSHDGEYFVYMRTDTIKGDTILDINKVEPNGLKLIQTISLLNEFHNNDELRDHFSYFKSLIRVCDNISIDVQINDNLDLLLCLSLKEAKSKHIHSSSRQGDSEQQEQPNSPYISAYVSDQANLNQLTDENPWDYDEDLQTNKVFLYIKGTKNGNQCIRKQMFSTQDVLANIKDFINYKLSSTKILFFNRNSVQSYSLQDQKLIPIGLQIRNQDAEEMEVMNVEVSGKYDNRCIITVKQSEELDMMVFWDLEKNVEIDYFDVSPNADVFYARNGQEFILDEDSIFIVKDGGRCMSFNISIEEFDKRKLFKGIEYGHKIDGENMDYIVIKNFFALPVSYFSLIYNNQLRLDLIDNTNFDVDGLNYIIDSKCELHELVLSYEDLEFVLNKYETLDPRLLELLLLLDNKDRTPLHVAIEAKSNRSINIILKKLSLISLNNSGNLKDIFDDLLNFYSFQEYLDGAFFQTLKMKTVQSLKISQEEVVIGHPHSYLDDDFYKKVDKQVRDESQVNIPVRLRAIDVSWIFQDKAGSNFLTKLSRIDNVNFLTAESSRIIINYMWDHYKKLISFLVLLPYLAYFGIFLWFVFHNETYLGVQPPEGQEPYTSISQINDPTRGRTIGLCIAILLFIAYFFLILVLRLYVLKASYMKGMWGWLDLFSMGLNLGIVIIIFAKGDIRDLRRISAIAVVIMWLKFLYFLRIFNSTAPLVRILIEIMYDMRAFMVIFFLGIFGMANGFYIIGKNQSQEREAYCIREGIDPTSDDCPEVPYEDIRNAIIFVYTTVIGDYSFDHFEIADFTISWIFFLITTLFVLIVLLNMLIALMGSTFNRVAEIQDGSRMRERLQLILENRFLSRWSFVKSTKYLISIEEIKDASEQDQALKDIQKNLESYQNEFMKLGKEIQNYQIQKK